MMTMQDLLPYGSIAAERIIDDDVVSDYLTTALWSSTVSADRTDDLTRNLSGVHYCDHCNYRVILMDDDRHYCDSSADDVFDADDADATTVTAAHDFLVSLLGNAPDDVLDYWTPDRFAHDAWLTRNGHGAGFWDRYFGGRGEDVGDYMTDLVKTYGSADIADNGDGTFSIEG